MKTPVTAEESDNTGTVNDPPWTDRTMDRGGGVSHEMTWKRLFSDTLAHLGIHIHEYS